jgi:predicted nucleic acid-binding protein
MKRFIDTFAFIAWLSKRDAAHGLVASYMANFSDPLVTTEWVLMEVADALSGPDTRAIAVQFLDEIRSDDRVTIVGYEPDCYAGGLRLFRCRPDKGWSLTDCISIYVMHEHGLTEALTGDHHFQQAGFKATFSDD